MALPTTPARKRRADVSLLVLGLVLLYPGCLMFSGARDQQELNETLGSTSGGNTVMILLMGVVCVGVPLAFIVFGLVGRVPPLCKTCGREMRRRRGDGDGSTATGRREGEGPCPSSSVTTIGALSVTSMGARAARLRTADATKGLFVPREFGSFRCRLGD
jgi:hypothetical protein